MDDVDKRDNIDAQQKKYVFSHAPPNRSLWRLYYSIKSTAIRLIPPYSLYQHSSTGAGSHQPRVAHVNVAQWSTAMMAAFCAIDNKRSCCSALRWPHATNLLPAADNMTIVLAGKIMQRHNDADEGMIF